MRPDRRQSRYPSRRESGFAWGAKAGCGCIALVVAVLVVLVILLGFAGGGIR